jgi:Pyruvate/2-oxoacid:ferredoxin oxidoreductase delta subunit
VRLELQRAPMAFLGGRRVTAVELAEVTLGAPGADGRRQPVVGKGRQRLACDLVLLALGQVADPRLVPAAWELREGQACEGSDALPVFAAGDFATGEGTVAHAIGDGRRAAQRALAALGEEVTSWMRVDPATALPASAMRFGHFPRQSPSAAWHRAAVARTGDFREVALGLADPSEARRCCSCGDCNSCDTCLAVCPDGVIHRQGAGYAIDLDYCKGCGLCVAECPRGGMELVAP